MKMPPYKVLYRTSGARVWDLGEGLESRTVVLNPKGWWECQAITGGVWRRPISRERASELFTDNYTRQQYITFDRGETKLLWKAMGTTRISLSFPDEEPSTQRKWLIQKLEALGLKVFATNRKVPD